MLNFMVKNRSLMLISVIYFLLIFTIGCSVKDDKHKDTVINRRYELYIYSINKRKEIYYNLQWRNL